MNIGRSVANVTHRARGKEPVQYELEVIPTTAWEIPPEHQKLLFAWERGSKVYVTDAVEVSSNRSVFWKQYLKQTATMYRDPNGCVEAKDYVFKLQSVKGDDVASRKTVAKIHFDFSVLCTGEASPQPVTKTLALQPFGKLMVTMKAASKHPDAINAKVNPGAMTDTAGSGQGRAGNPAAPGAAGGARAE